MSTEIQERVFEPYFTTKPKGEGTGMGLSVIHGIIKSIGGHVSVYSESGRGTAFHVYLPVIESGIAQTGVSPEKPIPTGTERIMLVDDEEYVRTVETEMLTKIGYKVKSFASPLDALENFTAQPNSFDMIITDMTMPKMTGDKLAGEILEIHPDMPVILCTGFSDLVNEESAKTLGIRKYVSKPVILQSFSRTIRNVLDGRVNNGLSE